MSVQNRLTVQVDHLFKESQTHCVATTTEKCEINVLVVNGWAITGHYQNNTLKTITLQKTSQAISSQTEAK
jgi:hypothetical protein